MIIQGDKNKKQNSAKQQSQATSFSHLRVWKMTCAGISSYMNFGTFSLDVSGQVRKRR